MKRPLFPVGCCIFGAMAAAFYFSPRTVLILLALPLLLIPLAALVKEAPLRRTLLILLFAAALGGSRSLLYRQTVIGPLDRLDGQSVSAEGTVLSVRLLGSRQLCEARVRLPDGEEQRITLFNYTETELSPGGSFAGTLRLSAASRDPEYGDRNLSRGVALSGILTGEPELLQKAVFPLDAGLSRWREGLRQSILRIWPQRGELLAAMITSDAGTHLSPELRAQMARAGLVHIVAISGLHLALAAALAEKMLRRLSTPFYLRETLVLLSIWAMAVFSGLGYPVVRAAIMATIFHGGRILGRRSDLLNSLGLAVIVILLWQPMAAGSLSFQLTCGAVLGLGALEPPLHRFLMQGLPAWTGKWGRGAVSLFSASIAAQLSLLPLLWKTYGWFSLLGVFTGLLVLPLLPALLSLGLLTVGLHALSPLAAAIPARLCDWLLGWIEGVSRVYSGFPVLWIDEPYQLLWAAGAALTVLWLALHRAKREDWQLAGLTLTCVLLVGSLFSGLMDRELIRVVTWTDSDAVLVERSGRAAVFGADGDGDLLLEELGRHGVRQLDLLVLPDDGFTRGAGTAELLRQVPPVYLLAPEDVLSRAYLDTVWPGERTGLASARGELLGGAVFRFSPGEGLLLDFDGVSLLKTWDGCAIMKNNAYLYNSDPARSPLLHISEAGEVTAAEPSASIRIRRRGRRTEIRLRIHGEKEDL